ncbi:MAG TPA: DUF4364 family protein [Clostridia bacterium]|nr:DUF4364 family protein [Clostridia bacterium]
MSFFEDGFTKDKIVVMYALAKLLAEPTREQMTTFFGQYDLMPFFELQSAVYELEEGGFLAAVPRPYGQAYCLTPKGKDTLLMFIERVPQSQRVQIDACADEYREKLRLQTRYASAVERTGRGAYRVTLKAMELNGELIRIDMLLPDEQSARRAEKAWPERAPAIYAAILAQLGKEGSDEMQ